jgi:hypothetical protein
MRIATTTVLMLVGWLAGATALAHEGGTHARGTVKEITADRIVIATAGGADVTVALGPETRLLRGHKAISTAEVHPGERAVVHAATHDGKLEATEVMVAEQPK